MAGGEYLQIIQGDSYVFNTSVTVNGVEQNIFGSDISFFAMGYDWGQEQILFTANTNTGQIAISGANNANIAVSFNSAFTQNIPQANVGAWFLRVATASDNVYTLDRGRICVMPGLPILPL